MGALNSRVWAGPLDYANKSFPATIKEVKSGSRGTEYLVKYPTALKSLFRANNTVWGHFFVPNGPVGRRYPCILVLPGMAEPNIWIENQFMKRFRKDGFAVMWIEMPYQFHRRPAPLVPSGQVFLAHSARELAFNFRESVLDARRTLSWIRKNHSVDPHHIGIFGISLGSLVGAATYSVDKTPHYAVFLLGGADFPQLVEHSAMTAAFIHKLKVTPQEMAKAWPGLDPIDYRAQNYGKKVFLMNGWFDHIIPRVYARKLKDAFPDSRQEWVPFGHYSSIINLFWLPRYVADKFLRNL